jgi:hypothetical protein
LESDVVGQADASELELKSLQSIALMNPRDLDSVGAGFLLQALPANTADGLARCDSHFGESASSLALRIVTIITHDKFTDPG